MAVEGLSVPRPVPVRQHWSGIFFVLEFAYQHPRDTDNMAAFQIHAHAGK